MYGDFKMAAMIPRKPRDWGTGTTLVVFVSLVAMYTWRLM